MPAKIFEVTNIGPVHIFKRRGSRSIRLSFDSKGNVRINIPFWVPYQTGISFALERADWIMKHRPETSTGIRNGDKIGKAHHLSLLPDTTVKTAQVRLRGSAVVVKYPARLDSTSKTVQSAAERGAKKALWAEAERLLPQRLHDLASQHNYQFRSVTVKQLKSKWGSCNQSHEITLNYYLMQLPWKLIDYVLIHELTHTEHLNHSNEFWDRFEEALPGAKKIRKELKPFKTAVVAG